jgi:hypothetical protein
MSLKNLLNKLFGRRESLKDAKFDIPPQQSYAKYENNFTEPTVPYPTQEKPKFVMVPPAEKEAPTKWFTIRFRRDATEDSEAFERHYAEASLVKYTTAAEGFDDLQTAVDIAERLRDAHWYPGQKLMDVSTAALFKLQVLGYRTTMLSPPAIRTFFTEGMIIEVLEWTPDDEDEEDSFTVAWSDKFEWNWQRDDELIDNSLSTSSDDEEDEG